MKLLAEVEMTRRRLASTIDLLDQLLYGVKDQRPAARKVDAAIAQAIVALQRLQTARNERGGMRAC
jgi:hypothetical protein